MWTLRWFLHRSLAGAREAAFLPSQRSMCPGRAGGVARLQLLTGGRWLKRKVTLLRTRCAAPDPCILSRFGGRRFNVPAPGSLHAYNGGTRSVFKRDQDSGRAGLDHRQASVRMVGSGDWRPSHSSLACYVADFGARVGRRTSAGQDIVVLAQVTRRVAIIPGVGHKQTRHIFSLGGRAYRSHASRDSGPKQSLVGRADERRSK